MMILLALYSFPAVLIWSDLLFEMPGRREREEYKTFRAITKENNPLIPST